MSELFEQYLVARSAGQPPWALGRDVPRRRFYAACAELSRSIEIVRILNETKVSAPTCPLLG